MRVRFFSALLAVTLTLPTAAAPAAKWVRYHDKASGLALSHPPGWTVSAHGTEIVVKSQDGNSLVMIRAFVHPEGEDPRTRLGQFPTDMGGLFRQANIQSIEPSGKGDELVGAFNYQTPAGPGLGRLICQWSPKKSVYFVVGGPSNRTAQDSPTLVKVLKTVAIDPPGRVAQRPSASTAGLSFVPWTDPREGAFRVEVPRGWKVDGGAFRAGPTDTRTALSVTSPDGGISISVGDSRLPGLCIAPNRITAMSGVRASSPIRCGLPEKTPRGPG